MSRITRFVFALAMIILAISVVWSYRVRAAEEAAQFAPRRIKPVFLPAGTVIVAVIRNGIARSAMPGETVTAFISTPVVSGGRLAIPTAALIRGSLETLSVSGDRGTARIRFTALCIRRQCVPIQTRPVVVVTPLQSDFDILGSALRTLLGATLGAAIGASSGDIRTIDRGLFEGARASVSIERTVAVTVILTSELAV